MRCRTDGDGMRAQRALVTARRARDALPPPTCSPSHNAGALSRRSGIQRGECAANGKGGECPPGDNDSVRAVGIATTGGRVAT